MYGDAPRSFLTGVPGWETPDEQKLLLKLAESVPPNGVILEIGGEYGLSASIFCKAIVNSGAYDGGARVITVDLFPRDLLLQHQSNLKEVGLGGISLQIVGDSSEVVKHWNKKLPRSMAVQGAQLDSVSRDGIDLLFIDGDHSINGALADFDNWTPLVKVGGFMAAHDCACATNKLPHVLHFDVTHALSDWYWRHGAEWKPVTTVDSLMVFERVK